MNATPLLSADTFLARYEGLRARLPGNEGLRAQAAAFLRDRGLPGPRDEAWKYTSLRPLAEAGFHEALTEVGDHRASLSIPALGPLTDMPRLVFANGRLRDDLSTLGDFAADHAAEAKPADNIITALNALLTEDGANLHVPAGQDGGIMVLIHIGTDLSGTPASAHPRHGIHIGEGASLILVDIASGQGTYLHNPVMDVTLDRGARLTHLRLQAESPTAFHLASVHAQIAEDASYDGFLLNLGAKLSRNEIHARLHGERGHAALNAAQLLGERQHGDFTTIVSHNAPSCTSRQTVKNVLSDHARAVFQGKIEVARAAQKTDGYQMNQTLLLSPDAEIDSKPQLEIYADDVKCSHGATVGELDADQLFYLTSRGIPAAEARAILVRAFLAEALDMVPDEATRALFEHHLQARWAA